MRLVAVAAVVASFGAVATIGACLYSVPDVDDSVVTADGGGDGSIIDSGLTDADADAAPFVDAAPEYVNISASADAGSGYNPSLAIDVVNGKLLVATQDGSNSYKPGLFRCNLDGTSCAYLDISAGAKATSGLSPSLAIDAANGRFLVATLDGSNGFRPGLFRCNLDGTSCAYLDISADAGASSGKEPSLAIDAANGKLLVATEDDSSSGKPGLFRCNLDGTSCVRLDISASAGATTGLDPSLAIDAANGKLLVATQDDSNSDKPSLFRCNLDGTSCAHLDISADAGMGSGYNPSLAIDVTNGRLLVATEDNSNFGKPGLFRCDLDGTSCAYLDISADAGANSGMNPSLAIDAANGKLLIATDDGSNNGKPALFRCSLDGTSCAHLDISAGAGANSGNSPSLAIDPATGEIVVATDDGSNNDRPALFLLR